ncbi:LysR family transcriptional regulator [Moraxella bovoculi]|uniref:LysR family transcriptional regulator n=1 Tax=Moraxella bovoculi 237 TaxID=743974 RepID=A0A066UNX1_9GAMM|nr:LysR family transcriptional regulator [Moraxella bovoculi]AKG17038.1 LysR family transcriptional regulator [Moraxella bovoculi]AKG18784.1 LysR family transcriptional regulator [Moraxella bovoculi]KDN25913.1 LysR family transcriptional regulator [Moraxella bovoculi 237]NSM10144.1 LysR family transcriptional regulator [Moraxella bovoculi]
MLDNLRGMAVFASVVRHGSFSGAAKELGITTSAVSQQIRSLELDLGVALLHRSTRKLSLSEAGESLYTAALQMVKAVEQGRDSVSQLKDEIAGSLRIATSPEIAREYLISALSTWLDEHENLSLNLIARGEELDMIEDRIDLAVVLEENPQGVTLTKVKQLLLASPSYLDVHDAIGAPKDLSSHVFITHGDKQNENLEFQKGEDKFSIRVSSRLMSNNQAIALDLAAAGYGIVKSSELNAKALIESGKLVPVLADYQLPTLTLGASTVAKEQMPTKAKKCLEMLIAYFDK